MGGIKQEQSDASQQPRASHSADQPQEEVSAATSEHGQLPYVTRFTFARTGCLVFTASLNILIAVFYYTVFYMLSCYCKVH